ncbi:helix-turn-helix transcriptional regulator [Micromonospora sp. C28SCA-DRY-2]|uniref:helix-turn-helix domain-containing protein n=1 Tax=Micromonospora sp. C28SCA-DRY-2 TaxID=3059522 RepID=UPI0026756DD5|nr:helix-turn-helix transcriptional regulator [Micromonospora sp. C28SCA-DRY-2]MDO3704063.1 helix-turn-helix transcriptional regulator [Micromonospora sp. C28SCA-DRY-2]
MGQTPRALQPSLSERHFFGAELRRLRERANLSQARLGAVIRFSADLVRRVETADRFPSREFVEACDKALGTGGALMRLLPLLGKKRTSEGKPMAVSPAGQGNLSSLLSNHSAETSRLAEMVVRVPFQPGVLDRAALDWLNAPAGPRLSVAGRSGSSDQVCEEDLYSAETALAMFRQLDHTHGAGRIHAQVQRYVEGELNRLLAKSPASEAIGRRLYTLAAGFFELCGYQAVDAGAHGLAQRRYLRALRLTQAADDRLYGSYLLAVNIGHLALHCGHPEPALRMALTAVRGSETQATPAVGASPHAVVARTHARLGREGDCLTHLDIAERQLARSGPEDEPPWIRYFNPAYLADEIAHCFHDLGRPQQTQRHVAEALTALSPTHVRRLAIDTALLASSLAAAGRIDEACATARAAVDHAARTTSHRCLQRIVEVQADLEPYRCEPEVREFGEYVRHQLPLAAV